MEFTRKATAKNSIQEMTTVDRTEAKLRVSAWSGWKKGMSP